MSTDDPKMDGVDEPKKLSTGIAALDEALSGDRKLDLSVFYASTDKTNFRTEAARRALKNGSVVVSLDIEAPTRASTWDQLYGRARPEGDDEDDDPDKQIMP